MWTFPKLKALLIDGSVTSAFEESVQIFTLRHASQLTGLSLTYHKVTHYVYEGPATITDSTWKLCRDNLDAFGIDMCHLSPENLGLLKRNTREGSCVDTPLSFIVTISQFGQAERPLDRIIDDLTGLRDSWKVDAFVLTDSWAEADECLDRRLSKLVENEPRPLAYLAQLRESFKKGSLVDAFGVTLGEYLQMRYHTGTP
jgi:hypothetical protein